MHYLRRTWSCARWTSIALALAALSALYPQPSAAQVLCRCALRTLEDVVCSNELSARVQVRWGLSLPSGSHLYYARVQEVFRGAADRNIWIEAPANCSFTLRTFGTYAIAVNLGENGAYSTFACSSFVKPWNELTEDEVATLRDPACSPGCELIDCRDGYICVLEPVWCIRAPCPAQPVCIPVPGSDTDAGVP